MNLVSSTSNLSTSAEPTGLLSLPDELLEIIFEFLSSFDLIQSVFSLNHARLNALIYPSISRVDLTTFPIGHLKSILNMISIARINSDLTSLIRFAPSLYSLFIIQTNPIDFKFLSFLPYFARHLKLLSIQLHSQCQIDRLLLPALIFQSSCSLETLTIIPDKMGISIGENHIVSCSSLNRITLSIVGLRQLFILCEYLLSLEYLRILSIEYCRNDRLYNVDQCVLGKTFSKHLHELWISGGIYYIDIELFVRQFALSLQYLTLRLSTGREPMTGHRLETGLINVCTELKKFQFYFYFNNDDKHMIGDIESFKYTDDKTSSTNYWSLHPVVCFDNIVASLPFTEWYFRSFGNAFPDTIHFNVPNPPPFKCIRQVALCEYDGPLSLVLFKFVERLFTRIDHLYISNGCCLEKFDWTLLPRFPKIRTMALGLYYKSCDDTFSDSPFNAASLRGFFSMVPNLRRLQTSMNFLKEHETVLRADQQLQDVAKRIEEVQMMEYENKQMEEFVISFFPNAKLRFDYRPYQFF